MVNSKEVTLYYYKLIREDKTYTVDCIERQAVEKPKSYIVTHVFRDNTVYNFRLLKADVGRVSGISGNEVVLTEPDVKKAQELLEAYYVKHGKRLEQKLAENNAILDAISKMAD